MRAHCTPAVHSPPAARTRTVIYAAKSTADERGSIPDQIEQCREYAASLGWEVVEPPESDEAASAYNGSRGPGLVSAKRRAATLAQEGGDVALLVFATDRLARGDGRTSAHLVEHVLDGMKAGYRVESVSENLGGDLALVFAALYGDRDHVDSKVKAAHVRRGLTKTVRDGRYLGSRKPYGFNFVGKREERRLVHNASEAATILRMADWYEAGAGFDEIAGRLNEHGIPSSTGGLWERSQVRNLLKSPLLAGFVHLRAKPREGREAQIFPGQHEPIIEPERWERLQAIRVSRHGKGRRPDGGHVFTGGILRCPECHSALRARTTPNGHAYYCCTGRGRKARPIGCTQSNIDARLIESLILGGLLRRIFDPDETRARIEQAAEREHQRAAKMLRDAERQLGAIERKRERGHRDYLHGKMSAELWSEGAAILDRERMTAEAHAAELREAAANVQEEAHNLEAQAQVVDRLHALQQVVAGEPESREHVEAVREALHQTFERVYLAPGPNEELVVIPVPRHESVVGDDGPLEIELRGGEIVRTRAQAIRQQPLPDALKTRVRAGS
jgi:site-specific DNA recombinase